MNILYVCSGNINRSPAAEFLSRKFYSQNCVFMSAGTSKKSVNKLVTVKTRKVLSEFGVDASAHRSKSVNLDMIEWADFVVCFSEVHVKNISQSLRLMIVRLLDYGIIIMV